MADTDIGTSIQPAPAPRSTADMAGLVAKLTRFEDMGIADATSSAPALEGVASRLRELRVWVAGDLARAETELDAVQGSAPVVHRGARHLLRHRGKLMRPMCVVLATRLGNGFGDKALDLAVAAEMIHTATLLHDDVIDVGDRRRGEPTARVLYGNTASILSGDWLLIQALRRVRDAAPGDIFDRALVAIEEMIEAEALQLANRGEINTAITDYFRVVEGKTAALFSWALYSGARVGGLPDYYCDQLEAYGARVGTAFQLVDDLLDFAGDADTTGKALFNDLREGRMTYPLLLALDRDRSLRPVVEELLSQPTDEPVSEQLVAHVVAAVHATGGAADCMDLAHERVTEAIACLGPIPSGRARAALITLAEAVLYRSK